METEKLIKSPFAAVAFLRCFLELKGFFYILWLGIQV